MAVRGYHNHDRMMDRNRLHQTLIALQVLRETIPYLVIKYATVLVHWMVRHLIHAFLVGQAFPHFRELPVTITSSIEAFTVPHQQPIEQVDVTLTVIPLLSLMVGPFQQLLTSMPFMAVLRFLAKSDTLLSRRAAGKALRTLLTAPRLIRFSWWRCTRRLWRSCFFHMCTCWAGAWKPRPFTRSCRHRKRIWWWFWHRKAHVSG